MIFDQINEISFELNDGNNFDVFYLRSFAMLLKQEQRKRLIQGTKLTFLARSRLAPKFSKVVAKAKKLGAIKKKKDG